MSHDVLTYLLDRFATDANTLRARAQMFAGKASPEHGPDSAASMEMADACDRIVAMLNDLSHDDEDELLDALDTLGPELHALAERAPDEYVRSVYGGAATRLQEVVMRARGDGHDDDDADPDE